MTWVALTAGVYIAPRSDRDFFAITPNDSVSYKLSRHCTSMCDAVLIGTYPDPTTAMVAAAESEGVDG